MASNAISPASLWQRVDHAERALCLGINRGCRVPAVKHFFAIVSRLGDGPLWYALMLLLAVGGGADGAVAAARLALTGVLGVGIYRLLKQRCVRERPYVMHEGILLGTAPLDRYSFPSGHTLHAVGFTLVATAAVPELALVLVPFTALVAASRVVLGLHYPSDVLAGAAIGMALGSAVLAMV
jgi:undecaprenyl-diphosphatase